MPRFTRILSVGLLAVTLSGGLVATHADAAPKSAGITVKAGPRLKAKTGFKTERFGAIKGPDGKLGFCIDYGLKSPNGSWGTGSVSSIKDPKIRAEATWLVNAYPKAIGTKTVEPAVKATLNRLVSADFRHDWKASYIGQLKGTGVVALSDRMLSDAKKYAGSVTVKTTLTQKPGKNGTGTIRATVTMNGRPATGIPLRWWVSGAKTSGGAKTGKDGDTVLKLTRMGLAPIAWTVQVVTPDWRRANYSTPTTKTRQHLVRGGFNVTARASGSYYRAVITQDCGTQCDGRPPMTLTATAGSKAVQWRAVSGTKVIGLLTLKAKKTGTAKFTGADGQHLLIQYRVKGGKWRTAQTIDVVCPPWPEITPVKKCACKGKASTGYAFLIPNSVRTYTVRLDIAGTVQERTLTGGQSATLTGPIKAGDKVTASFTVADSSGRTLASAVLDTWTQG